MKKQTNKKETANVLRKRLADLQETWRTRPRKNTRQSDSLEKQKQTPTTKRGVSKPLHSAAD